MDEGALAVIISAMAVQMNVAAVARVGCRVLCKLLKYPACQQAALDAEVPTAIVTAMMVHEGDAEIAEYGCSALRQIALLPGGQQSALDEGAPAVIVAAITANMAEANIAVNGMPRSAQVHDARHVPDLPALRRLCRDAADGGRNG